MRLSQVGTIGITGVALALMALAVGCKREASAMAPMERPPAPVVMTAAIAQDVPVYIDQIGRTAARESVTIVPQVSGKITQLHFTDGANIKKGDLLFTIDARPFDAAVKQAQATLAESRAQLKFAYDESKRMEEIRNSGAVSITEWEQKVNAVAVAEAQVMAGEAAVQTATLNLEYCAIHSPIDGKAGVRLVDAGNVVNAGGPDGGTKLLMIQAFDPIYADFTVTENELGTVRKFMKQGRLPQEDPQGKLKVFVDVPGDAQQIVAALGGSAAGPAAEAAGLALEGAPAATQPTIATTQALAGAGPREGRLTFLDNTVQQGTGTVRVRATLPNSDSYFWPGQFVRVRLVLTTRKNAVLVPAQAQQIGQQGPYVYVVKQGKVKDAKGEEQSATIAEIRPVTPGQRQGDMVVIEQGLSAGEQVVVQGHMGVTPGGPVRDAGAPQGAPHVLGSPTREGGVADANVAERAE
ncbi:MAG: efflux RND transporter periplasmic adaptor subunit [Tepidisphaeraceae bacterium]